MTIFERKLAGILIQKYNNITVIELGTGLGTIAHIFLKLS